jgi:hypothetical protein
MRLITWHSMFALIENLKSEIQNRRISWNRGRLVRHYFLISLVLISGGLITSGVSELYFRYRESAADLVRLQQEITAGQPPKSSNLFKRSSARREEPPKAVKSPRRDYRRNIGSS